MIIKPLGSNPPAQEIMVTIRNHHWRLPAVLPFMERGNALTPKGYYFYIIVDFRPPLKGEMYISGGGIHTAYHNLNQSFLVVRLAQGARAKNFWVKKEE